MGLELLAFPEQDNRDCQKTRHSLFDLFARRSRRLKFKLEVDEFNESLSDEALGLNEMNFMSLAFTNNYFNFISD